MVKDKEFQLDDLRKQLEKQGDEEYWMEESTSSNAKKVKQMNNELEGIKDEQDFE